MILLVLAGGFGTRLQSALKGVPKALAPVGSKPFMHLQIQNWIDQGVRNFVFLLHHNAEQVVFFLDSEKHKLLKDCEVSYVIEEIPLNTGGAVAHAVKKLNLMNDFLVINADTWLGGGIKEVWGSPAPSLAVIDILNNVSRYGQVKFDKQLHVTSFVEKEDALKSSWINAGLTHLRADFFMDWDGGPVSLEHYFLAEFVRLGLLKAVPLKVDFIDIGIPADYSKFCQWEENNRRGVLCD